MSKAKKAAKQLFVGSLFSKIFTFIGSILLARILFPEDFGYLLMAMIVTAFASQIGNMGFENFYLQEKIENEEHEKKILNITFKLRIFVNILLFIIQFFGSYLIVKYFNEQIVGELLRIFSFEYLIMAVTQVNLYILRKKLEYKPEVLANFSRDIFGTIAKVLFAYSGFGALSFAIGSLIGSFIRMIIILKYQSFKPDLKDWNKEIFSKVFFFGKHSFISGITMYLSSYIDKILLTKFFSAGTVGLYSFANNQAQMPSAYLVLPQGSLFLSYIANNKEDPNYLLKKLILSSYFITVLMLPILVVLSIYSYEIFEFVFGQKWLESVPLFNLFLIMFFFDAIMFPYVGLLTGYGKPEILSKINIYKLLCLSIFLFTIGNLSSNILHYVLVYIVISIVFNFLKSYIGLKIMNVNLIFFFRTYLKLSILIFTLGCINYLLINFDNRYIILSLILLFVYFFIIDKKMFFESLDIFFERYKIYKNIRIKFVKY